MLCARSSMLRRRIHEVVELGRHLGADGGAARVVVRQARASAVERDSTSDRARQVA